MTNPDNVGGLPEPVGWRVRLSERGNNPWGPSPWHLESSEPKPSPREFYDVEQLHTADQMRAYAELCRAAPAGGECQHEWQPDADVMNARYCPKCDVTQTIPRKPKDSAPAGSGEVSYRWLDELRDRMDHCISAADEGEDYAVPREYLDAMTTLGLMKKVGRGKWAPTEEGEAFAQRKPTLPVNIYGKTYEVPIPVQLHIVALEDAAALLRKLQQGADYVMVPRSLAVSGAEVCAEWLDLFAETPGLDKYERYTYAPCVEITRDQFRAASQGQEGGHG